MEPDLAIFLASHPPRAQETAVWADARLSFQVTCYLGSEPPPLDYVTSVRSLLFRDDTVLIWRDAQGLHLLPGGRREEGETLEETLERELLEETGWRVTDLSMLGFMHYRHLSPKPVDYRYAYPDFMQIVYTAMAAAFVPGPRVADGCHIDAAFRPIAEVQGLDLSPGQRLYLEAALSGRSSGNRDQ